MVRNMIQITGKYNTAIIYNDTAEYKAQDQIRELCNLKAFSESKIRVMPDVHAGIGCTVGTTMTITNRVIPNVVGVDCGCGMYVVKLKEKEIDFSILDKVIRRRIPSGRSIRQTGDAILVNRLDFNDLRCSDSIDMRRAIHSLGTLGGGNHFIEVDRGEDGSLYLVIHSGSRHLGVEIAEYYQEKGWLARKERSEKIVNETIAELSVKRQEAEIEGALDALKENQVEGLGLPKELSWVEGQDFIDYLHDMDFAQRFAGENRKAMAEIILRTMKLNPEGDFTTIHNYIDLDMMILRKGAVSAKSREILLIPMNMRDGSFICKGKGNPDWNYSAPHGAGRLFSRKEAREKLSVEEFKKEMDGIWSTSIGKNTIDESPMVYKSAEEIMVYVEPAVEILEVIKPVYNFKAGN